MIIGVAHHHDGRAVQRLPVCTKVSIGLPANGDRNHPTKLDHFVFLRNKKSANRIASEADLELTRHYGEECREPHIMLIDGGTARCHDQEAGHRRSSGMGKSWCFQIRRRRPNDRG
jgi:hypothetical protein